MPDDAPVFGNLKCDWPNPYNISDHWRDAVRNRRPPKVTSMRSATVTRPPLSRPD
jgi:hypothetical protein